MTSSAVSSRRSASANDRFASAPPPLRGTLRYHARMSSVDRNKAVEHGSRRDAAEVTSAQGVVTRGTIEIRVRYRECDPMGDHDPYGGSKGAAELAVRAYQHSFFPVDRLAEHDVWLATARAGNVIGGGDWTADALIVDTVAALVADQPVSIRSPHAVRPWQHVLQCLSGYLTIAARLLARQEPRVCGNWNIGPYPGGELTVREIVEYFIACWGSGRWVDASPQRVDREAEILRLSIDKALTHLGWCPTWDVRTTLEMTAEWFQAFQTDPKHMQRVSNAQIEKFQADFFVRTQSLTPTAGRCP